LNSKHIVLVANTTWNIFNFRLNLIQKFLSEGFEVSVVAPIDEYIEYKERYPKVKHYNLHYLKRTGINPIFDILFCLELIRRYRLLKPDIVIHFTNKPNIYGGIAAIITKTKSIATITGLGYAFIHKGIVNKLLISLYKITAKFHQKFIFENIDDRSLFEKLNIINSNQGLSVKGCGVDINYFYPRPKLENERGDSIKFAFIARLLWDKGIREYFEAAKLIKKKFPKTLFYIAGEMDDKNPTTITKENLVDWIESNTIHYSGFQKDVRNLLGSVDCVVLPSYREAIPRTLTEAMAMGLPIITTDVPGCREAVDDGQNGFIVKPKSVDSLFLAMEKFLNLSSEKKIMLGENGRKKAEKEFDDRKIADYIFITVQNILN